jgi:aspartyl-tRNA(Asn)/glutamyl-tRNA(Gln) amidotransferase subunit B
MRVKEGAEDYRYFPEPDLVPLHVDDNFVKKTQLAMPELPAARRKRYRDEMKLHPEAVYLLASERNFSDYFETLLKCGVPAPSASAWMTADVQRILNENQQNISEFPVSPDALADLILIVERGAISRTQAKTVFKIMLADSRSANEIIEAEGLTQISDSNHLREIVENLVVSHPDETAKYRAGKKNLLGFFIGEAMKSTSGQAEPKTLKQIVEDVLDSKQN